MTPDLLNVPASSAEVAVVAERAQFGVASAPFDVRTLPEAKGQALSFTTSAWYRLAAETWLGVQLPLVAASVQQPAGSYVDEAAWGNPEIRFAKRLEWAQGHALSVRLTLGAGIGLPIAKHDASLMPNRALGIASATLGFGEPELFTPGELPLTPFTQLEVSCGRVHAFALLKLPLLARVSDADLPAAQSSPRALAFQPVLQLEARYALTRHFGVALAPQLAVDAVSAAEHVRRVPALQLLLRASPYFEIDGHGALGIDVQAPVAGSLGGSTVALGVRGSIAF